MTSLTPKMAQNGQKITKNKVKGDKMTADILSKDNQLQKFVQSCRKNHGGPLEKDDEVDPLVDRFRHDEEKLRSALTRELRYRKYSTKNIKFDNPLFKQQNVGIDVLITNLKLLLMKTDVPMAAR